MALDLSEDRKKDILADFRDRDRASADIYIPFLNEAEIDFGFYACRQWDDADRERMERELRPCISLNQTMTVINTVVGSEITNRYDIRYLPRTPGELREQTGRIMTETVRFIREKCKANAQESKAFWDAVICGLGCIEIYQDYEVNPDGQQMIKRVSPFDLRPDPMAREQNLEDKKYVIRRALVPSKDFKFLWPEAYDKIKEVAETSSFDYLSGTDGIQRALGYAARDSGIFYDKRRREYLVNDYQWFERSKFWRVQHPLTGQVEDIQTEEEFDEAISRIREEALVRNFALPDDFGETNVARIPKRDYWRAYICGSEVMSASKIKTNDFTYMFITGFEDHRQDHTTWFGMMKPMRDPQRYTNKFFSQMIYIMATNPKGGYWYEDGAFVDEEEAKRLTSQPNSMIKLLPGGKAKIFERESLGFPSGLDVMMQHAINAIPNTTGVNYFLQGLQNGSQPGVVVQSYQKQGMVILSVLFDALNQYREKAGDNHLSFVREYMPDNVVVRINDERGAPQLVQYSKDYATHKYDIVVTQSPASPNMQKEFWDMMVQTNLLGQMMELGYPIPSSIFNYMPLPEQFKRDWIQEIEAAKMAEQQAQASAAMTSQPAPPAEGGV